MNEDNNLLGKFHLAGITPTQRGLPQVGVTFNIDGNGTLDFSAGDESLVEKCVRDSGIASAMFMMLLLSAVPHEFPSCRR